MLCNYCLIYKQGCYICNMLPLYTYWTEQGHNKDNYNCEATNDNDTTLKCEATVHTNIHTKLYSRLTPTWRSHFPLSTLMAGMQPWICPVRVKLFTRPFLSPFSTCPLERIWEPNYYFVDRFSISTCLYILWTDTGGGSLFSALKTCCSSQWCCLGNRL